MRKTLCLAALLLICLATAAYASEEALDGKQWTGWLESRKVYFLTGMFEGVRLGGDLAIPQGSSQVKSLDVPLESAKPGKPAKAKAEKAPAIEDVCHDKAQAAFDLNTTRYFFGVSIARAVELLDRFYKDPRNQVIPVRNALIALLKQQKGEDVGALIEELRKPD